MSECFIRGSIIKYLRIPDDVIDKVKEDMQASRVRNRDLSGRGGGGVNRNKFRGEFVFSIAKMGEHVPFHMFLFVRNSFIFHEPSDLALYVLFSQDLASLRNVGLSKYFEYESGTPSFSS